MANDHQSRRLTCTATALAASLGSSPLSKPSCQNASKKKKSRYQRATAPGLSQGEAGGQRSFPQPVRSPPARRRGGSNCIVHTRDRHPRHRPAGGGCGGAGQGRAGPGERFGRAPRAPAGAPPPSGRGGDGATPGGLTAGAFEPARRGGTEGGRQGGMEGGRDRR